MPNKSWIEMPNKSWIQTIRSKVVGFFYNIETMLALFRVVIFGLLGYAIHYEFVFSGNETAPEKRRPDVSSSAISDDLVQLLGWSVLGMLFSYGIVCLIIEAMEGGMSLEPERTFGAVFFIFLSATLVIMVIPEIVRSLKKMGYIKAQLAKGKRAFL